jgi:hypothetical protein
MCAISSCSDLKLNSLLCTCQVAPDNVVPKLLSYLGSVFAEVTARFRPKQPKALAPSRQSCIRKGLLLMELFMMLLENMPLLFRVHPLHLLTERQMIIPQNLEPLVKPLESFQHSHTPLLPEHTGNLGLLRPHGIFLLLVVGVELGVLVVAHGHRATLVEKLGIGVHWLFRIQGRRLHQGCILHPSSVIAGVTTTRGVLYGFLLSHVALPMRIHVALVVLAILRSSWLLVVVALIGLLLVLLGGETAPALGLSIHVQYFEIKNYE